MVMFQTSDPDLITARNAMLADNWWLVALRGLFAILFGVIAFVMPAAAMLGLVLVFAAYSIADGISNIVLAVRGARRHERWGLLLLNGLQFIYAARREEQLMLKTFPNEYAHYMQRTKMIIPFVM